MAELHTNLYIKHHDQELNAKLTKVFKTINDKPEPNFKKTKENLLNDALAVSPDNAKELVKSLLKSVKKVYGSPSGYLVAESRQQIGDYHSYHFVHGRSGIDIIRKIIWFLGKLAPGIDVRACLVGDDDPWEIFYRFENGEVVNEYYEPDYDEAKEDTLPEVYQWWHEGLPSRIKDGFINEWKNENK
ncbi:hypothetical protein [Zooshikella harenae]|uniref:Uncharacterized protein n=1 Tax=Zooshikella harenae TaxID=2827238 RepID=A0ABS5ZJF1_9GAMM|nr:hypothetical protein [Zooshikella harenae]MBU2714219.1 hypothetical protein [Zooshikella harenae]